MIRDLWTLSLFLLNAFISVSLEDEINAEIEGYDQGNLQNVGPPEIMVSPKECFEVCNDYECLYLCPQPLRGVKRCITPLQSNRKSCCQNGQTESPTGNGSLKGAGKHIWQAREQLLGIRKEIENNLANRRFSLLKGLQPFSLKQHNRDSLFKLGAKTSKNKSNSGPLICPVSEKKTTVPPNNCVNTKHIVTGTGSEGNNENHTRIFEQSKESENWQIPDNNGETDEIILSTTVVPVLGNEYITSTGEQESFPNPGLITDGKEEIQNSFTEVSGSAGVFESGNAAYDINLPETSHYDDFNSPNIKQSNSQYFLNQPSPFSSRNTDQPYNDNDVATFNGGDGTETANQNMFQSDPTIFYEDSYRSSPMEIENNVLSQTNRDDVSYTTPLMNEHSSSDISTPSKLKTAVNIEAVDYGQTPDFSSREFQNSVRIIPGSIGDEHSGVNENILAESNDKVIVNDNKSYTYAGNGVSFLPFTTKESNIPKTENVEESTKMKTDIRDETIPNDSLKRVLADNYLGSGDSEYQSTTPSEMNIEDVNFFSSNETVAQNEINHLNKSENNFYVEKGGLKVSSNNLNDTELSYDYQNDYPSSNVDEKPETNRKYQSDHNNLLETLKLAASANDHEKNYTIRILEELISKYNITSDLKNEGSSTPVCQPISPPLDHQTSKHRFPEEKPISTSDLTFPSTDVLQNMPIENEFHLIEKTAFDPAKIDVDNETEEESIHAPTTKEINEQLLSEASNITRVNTPVESISNILKSYGLNDQSEESNFVSNTDENTTSGYLETIMGITKDNISSTIIGDNVNRISSDDDSNRTQIETSHSLISRSEQSTTTSSVYLSEKVSLENAYYSQIGFHPKQLGKTTAHIITNETDWKPENKNMNIHENQLYAGKIEKSTFEKNFSTSSESVAELKNPAIVNQELLYDAGNSETSNTDFKHLANVSVDGSVDDQLYNETYGNYVNEQSEKFLQLIPNVSDIPLTTNFKDKTAEIKNHDIEDVYLRLGESNENSSGNSVNEENHNDLYRPQNPDEISTELNDSESKTLDEKIDGSNEKKLSDIINTELNNIKQQNVVLKKREEEEIGYGDDSPCDCEFPAERDEEPAMDPSLRPPGARANAYPHPVYPMFIVIPVPYHVCDCENKTDYNRFDNNIIKAPYPYAPREPLPDYSVYNDIPNGREGKAVRAPPPYMPNFFFPFVPWGGMYPMDQPYHQVFDQRVDNHLERYGENEEEGRSDAAIDCDHNEEVLSNNNPEDIIEFHQESESISNTSETPRFSRDERKQTGITKYEFIDGQYVKVVKNEENIPIEDGEGNETPEKVTEAPPLEETTIATYIQEPTTATYIQEPITVAIDTNENSHRPVNYFYPSDFGAPNRFYNYYPSYFFTRHR